MPTPQFKIELESINELLADGLEDILSRHWEEIALDRDTTPLAVDWQTYRDLERAGILKPYVMRTPSGALMGYNVHFLRPPLHYSTERWSANDILFLDQRFRKGRAGIDLVRGVEPLLREAGAQKVIYHTKLHVEFGHGRARATLGRLFQAMGYLLSEEVWTKRL